MPQVNQKHVYEATNNFANSLKRKTLHSATPRKMVHTNCTMQNATWDSLR